LSRRQKIYFRKYEARSLGKSRKQKAGKSKGGKAFIIASEASSKGLVLFPAGSPAAQRRRPLAPTNPIKSDFNLATKLRLNVVACQTFSLAGSSKDCEDVKRCSVRAL